MERISEWRRRSGIGYLVILWSLYLTRPPMTPIHREPSCDTSSAEMLFRSRNVVKRAPSNRAKPSSVANQRYPSGVCAIAPIEFCGNPSSDDQELRPYCVLAMDGSSARSGVARKNPVDSQAAMRMALSTLIRARLCSKLPVLGDEVGCRDREQTLSGT